MFVNILHELAANRKYVGTSPKVSCETKTLL